MRRWIWTWILLISYWNLTLGSEQYKSDFSSVKSNVSITLPFEMVSGVMLVQATVNGQQGKYILDTGAPELMVFQEAQPPLEGEVIVNHINSQREGFRLYIEQFQMADIQASDFWGLQVENPQWSQRNVLGLVGYDLIRDYTMIIDYPNRTIFLVNDQLDRLSDQWSIAETSRISLSGHFPIVKVRLDGRTYRFALDTGSEANFIFNQKRKIKADTPRYFHQIKLNGNEVEVESQTFSCLQLKDICFNNHRFYLYPFRMPSKQMEPLTAFWASHSCNNW
jgi:hypothetical protein